MRRDAGVALVLVLAVTGVLALLILQIALTSRSQIAQTQVLVDRAEATLRLQSRETALLYSMLTRERNADPRQVAGDNPYAQAWNFRGEPFLVDGADIRLQDVGGLFPMPSPGSGPRDFAALLAALRFDPDRAEKISRSLVEALLQPRPLPLQSMEELAAIAGLTSKEIDLIKRVATLYPVATTNFQTAPDAVLAVKYSGVTLEGLLAARREGALDGGRVRDIIGENLDDMTTTSLVGPGFKIDVSIEFRGVKLRRESVWTIRPTNDLAPLQLWSCRDLAANSDVVEGAQP